MSILYVIVRSVHDCGLTNVPRTTSIRGILRPIVGLSSDAVLLQGRALPVSMDKRVPLVSRSLDVLPAEEAGINRPGTGSNHGQGGAEDRQYHVNPGIARL